MPDGWPTGIIFLTVVPVGWLPGKFLYVRFSNLFSVSDNRQEKIRQEIVFVQGSTAWVYNMHGTTQLTGSEI
jgi:hypothetical protein